VVNIASDPYLRGFRQALWGGALGGFGRHGHALVVQDMHKDDVLSVVCRHERDSAQRGRQKGEMDPG